MQSTSRSLVLALAVAAAAAITPNSAKAETSVQVPFSFTAAGKTLPAGRYIVNHDSISDTVTLRSKDGSLTWIVGPSEMDPNGNHVVLQFDADGPIHVLRQIHYGSSATGRLDKASNRFGDDAGRAPSGR